MCGVASVRTSDYSHICINAGEGSRHVSAFHFNNLFVQLAACQNKIEVQLLFLKIMFVDITKFFAIMIKFLLNEKNFVLITLNTNILK